MISFVSIFSPLNILTYKRKNFKVFLKKERIGIEITT